MTDKYEGHTEKLFVSGIRTRIGGEPVLQIMSETDDKVYAFVLYGDGSNEQHKKAYADANLYAAAPDLLAENKRLREALTTIRGWREIGNVHDTGQALRAVEDICDQALKGEE